MFCLLIVFCKTDVVVGVFLRCCLLSFFYFFVWVLLNQYSCLLILCNDFYCFFCLGGLLNLYSCLEILCNVFLLFCCGVFLCRIMVFFVLNGCDCLFFYVVFLLFCLGDLLNLYSCLVILCNVFCFFYWGAFVEFV